MTEADEGPRGDLFSELRRIKDASRLSYNRLAERTHYSRSSWERFLNAKQLPTRVAVEQFAAAAGEDPEPLLVLLDRAAIGPETPAEKAARATGKPTGAAEPVEPPQGAERVAGDGPDPTDTGNPAVPPAGSGPVPEAAGAAVTDGRSRGPRRFLRSVTLHTAVGVIVGGLLGSALTLYVSGTGDGAPRGTAAARTDPSGAGAASMAVARKPKVSCESDTCLRREPQAHDCHWDAITVRETFLRGMSIQLRYSAACQAVWGRIENGDVGDTVTVRDKRGTSDTAMIRMEHDTYTRMLAVTPDEPWETITVCGAIPSQKEQECSPLGELAP
ncbi:DUF2690 domain-containing protein [Streptomyces sp. JNUCC 64]